MPDIYRPPPPPTTTTSAKFVRGGRKGNVGERREEGRERQKRTKRGGMEGCRQRGKSEKVRGSKRKCRPPPSAPLSVLLLLRAALQEMEWMGDACNGEQGWIADAEGGNEVDLARCPPARPDPELTAAVQSHDPPRAKLYHIHSSPSLLSSFPFAFQTQAIRIKLCQVSVCLSVCPPACRAEIGGRRRKGVRHSSCKVHFLNSESRTWRESGETNACSLKLHTLMGRLLNTDR